MWVRVDNRFVHGQVIESWVPYTQSKAIWVLNDELAEDQLRQEIMRLAIPEGVGIRFSPLFEAPGRIRKTHPDPDQARILVLLANCADARIVFEQGLNFSLLNIANIHYSPGREQVCDHVALGEKDVACLHFFQSRGVDIDFRCVPGKPVYVKPIW